MSDEEIIRLIIEAYAPSVGTDRVEALSALASLSADIARLSSEIESHKSSRRMWQDQCAGWASKASEWAVEKDALTADLAAARKERDEAVARAEKAEMVSDDLAMLVKKLVRKLPEGHQLRQSAMDYLTRENLQGSPLRAVLKDDRHE